MSKAIYEQNLTNANHSVSAKAPYVKDTRFRQRYHFMAPACWVNDPNGLIHFKGLYHLFYQHHPYSPEWGEMYWGHAVSHDLVHWKHLPIALAPSEDYDHYSRGGCFSGSAVDNNGVLTLLYTGAAKPGTELLQQQCLAYSTDGIHFEKYDQNPVIAFPPADGSKDFRDPKIFRHGSSWYVVIGSCKDRRGKALLYKSSDMRRWEYIGVMAESRGELGTMWECPDFFPLADKSILMFSPMGLGDRKAVYLTGDMGYKTGKFNWSTIGEVDWGFDYYAPQSLKDEKGRHILIGWANSWDWMPWWNGFGPTYDDGWCGAMGIPRKVDLCRDGRMRFEPIEELKTLRKEPYHIVDRHINENDPLHLSAGDGISYELEADVNLTQTNAARIGFKLRCSDTECTAVICDLQRGELIFDRTHADAYSSGIRHCPLESAEADQLHLHIFVDTCSVEVFADNGRTVMSSNIFPSQKSRGLYFFSEGGHAHIDTVQTWGLSSIW